MVICRNERVGMWSQSEDGDDSPLVFSIARLMLPAFAPCCPCESSTRSRTIRQTLGNSDGVHRRG